MNTLTIALIITFVVLQWIGRSMQIWIAHRAGTPVKTWHLLLALVFDAAWSTLFWYTHWAVAAVGCALALVGTLWSAYLAKEILRFEKGIKSIEA
jgi:hypothetical protein